jgi:hypothetical protein
MSLNAPSPFKVRELSAQVGIRDRGLAISRSAHKLEKVTIRLYLAHERVKYRKLFKRNLELREERGESHTFLRFSNPTPRRGERHLIFQE